MKKIERRVQLLKAMHEVVFDLNNDEAYLRWINLVPDCPTMDNFENIAEDTDDMKDVCDLFAELINDYSEDGWFLD